MRSGKMDCLIVGNSTAAVGAVEGIRRVDADASVTLPVGPHLAGDDAGRVGATVAALAEVHVGAIA